MTFLVLWSPSEELNRRAINGLAERAGPGAIRVEHHDGGRVVFCELARRSRTVDNHEDRSHLLDSQGPRAVGELRFEQRTQLSRDLGLRPDLGSVTDSALIGRAYALHGEDCALRLSGEFAFVVWDPTRQRIFAARDPCGAVPLYYARFREGLVFAPDLGALLSLSVVSRRPNRRALVDCLGEFPEDEGSTEFSEVHRLPPGHGLIAQQFNVQVRQYYFLDPHREMRLADDTAYAEQLRAALEQAVRIRTPVDSPCAVMLSGGLDSSFVAALASKHVREASDFRLTTVSAIFDEFPRSDERAYQQDIAASSHTRHIEVRPNSAGPSGDWQRATRCLSQPSFVGPHWLAWDAAQAVASDHSVVLTGIDGDRVVWHGQGLLDELASRGEWRALARETFALPNRSAVLAGLRFIGHASRGFVPSPVGRWADWLRRRGLSGYDAGLRFIRPERLIEHSIRDRLCSRGRASSARQAHWQSLAAPDRAKDMELLYALGRTLGTEFRHPFNDRQVVELCLSLPGAQKLREGKSRFVLRRAMAGLVPEGIRARPRKAYLDEPYVAWLRTALRRGSQVHPIDFEILDDYVDPKLVAGLLADVLAGRNAPVDFVWRCTIVAFWLGLV